MTTEKRLVSFAGALVLAVGLIGCGGAGEAPEAADERELSVLSGLLRASGDGCVSHVVLDPLFHRVEREVMPC